LGIETPLRILVAPLDWGLGHTTRCVPIIRYLLSLGHKVTVAGNDWQRSYIEETFPGIETIHLDGYNVRYGTSGKTFLFNILKQLPRLLGTVKKEHRWLGKLQTTHPFDLIIADNRYGLYHQGIPCVIMTHQLQIQTGLGNYCNTLLRHLHYRLLHKFAQCWVVDVAGAPNLSGKLAHPKHLPRNAHYIGLLSQVAAPIQVAATDHSLLVLLSGPEPQRTILSDTLWAQLSAYKGNIIFVEGTDGGKERTDVPVNVSYHKRLTGQELQPILQAASLVICRSGYSTVMDLVALQKKAILIPTPGQTEQEYIARHLSRQQVFLSAAQQGMNLKLLLDIAIPFPFHIPCLQQDYEQFKLEINHLLNVIL